MADGKERIALGSGDLYCTEYKGEPMPTDKEIETKENRLGYTQGGASIEYKPEFYTAEDDQGYVKKTVMTKEEVTLKSGIMTWNGNTLAKLCSTARVTEDKINGKRTTKIGGVGNQDGKQYIIRFVHKDEQDGDCRITIVGQNTSGFALAFSKDKETVIEAEFKALPNDADGTLVIYEEDIQKTTE